MTIFRPKNKVGGADVPVADTSYQSDALAQMIVDAWTDANFRRLLLTRGQAKAIFAARGIYLSEPVVITEDEYNNKYYKQDDDEVVFVLPNETRAQQLGQTGLPSTTLLDTARLLMAAVPNGI